MRLSQVARNSSVSDTWGKQKLWRAGVKQTFAITTMLLVLGSASQAEVVGGDVQLSFGSTEVDGLANNVNELTASGSLDFQVSNSFGFQAGLGFERASYSEDGVDVTVSATNYDLYGYYQLESFRAGAFIGRTSLGEASIDGFTVGLDQDVTNYGLVLQISNGGVTVGGSYGMSDFSDVTGEDASFFSLDATFAVTDALSIAGFYDSTSYSITGLDGDLTSSSLQVGAEYALDQWVNAPVVVAGYLGRYSADDGEASADGTMYGASISYLFGADTSTDRRRLFRSFVSPF